MADEINPNYSGGHWGALKLDGTRITNDASLMRGWLILTCLSTTLISR